MIPAAEIKAALAGCTGSMGYHRVGLRRDFVGTDGALMLAEKCGAFWLLDVIASHQTPALMRACRGFQVWRVRRDEGHGCVVACDDGDDSAARVRQDVEYTDLPFDAFEDGECRLYVTQGDGVLVVMLPSEY